MILEIIATNGDVPCVFLRDMSESKEQYIMRASDDHRQKVYTERVHAILWCEITEIAR